MDTSVLKIKRHLSFQVEVQSRLQLELRKLPYWLLSDYDFAKLREKLSARNLEVYNPALVTKTKD